MILQPVVLSASAPGHLNEDCCYCALDDDQALLLVVDGAGQRLPTTATAALYQPPETAARYAARLVRDTVAVEGHHNDPAETLLLANDVLYDQVSGLYGDLHAHDLIAREPHLRDELEADERLVRLALPVCVATLAQIDFTSGQLTFAHGGDTALYIFYADGRVEQVTNAQTAEEHDNQALYVARTLQQEQGLPHLEDVLDHPDVQRANRKSGLYHNYVDAHGRVNAELGIAVINGLPELEFYLQRGQLDLAGVAGVLLCTDGFIWPARWGESTTEREQRLLHMRERVEQDGLGAYLAALRDLETADSQRDLHPRFKIHDDVTAVYLRLDI